MKFAIISDSHDNIPNIDKAVAYLKQQNITFMIHCGDIAGGEVAKYLANQFGGEIHAITGNVTASPENIRQKTAGLNFTLHDETGEVEFDGKKIAFNHYPPEAEKLAKGGKYDLVFYGHDHKPWEKMVGKTKLLNPGTLAGLFQKATFAIYDTATDKAQLILLEKI